MKIGPKYKIAKRLGAPIFEKTQTQKFALSEARGVKRVRSGRRPNAMSDFKRQLLEKQKMRYTYGLTEKQLRRYVDEAVAKGIQPIPALIARLELRLDNVVYRLGLAKTRRAARQMVSHGHITVESRKMTIPSYKVRIGETIAVRDGSKNTGLFTSRELEAAGVPNWLVLDTKGLSGKLKSEPVYEPAETLFDPEFVLEYYSR
jgi:small subunit ribosomal protein S4